MRAGLIAVGVLGAALLGAAPAYALTDGESQFLSDMAGMGISASHGHIDDNAKESREVLGLGYGRVCDRLHGGWTPLDVERNIIVAEATKHSMFDNNLSRDEISTWIDSARRNLCPDTL